MRLQELVFRYLASEELCSRWELMEYARLQGATPDAAAELLAGWLAHEWLEELTQGERHVPPLLHLTDRAYEVHPWLAEAS